MTQIDMLDYIKETYKQYIDIDCENPVYVYKMCNSNNNYWLVIMKKLPNTITNESRKYVQDKKYAKFRASELEVIAIINIQDAKTIDTINNIYRVRNIMGNAISFSNIIYKIGCKVKPDRFDFNLDVICSNGIHYFNSIEAAYFYRFNIPNNY